MACVGFISNSANASISPELYTVQIPVLDNSLETRNQSFPDALEQVLIQVAGTDSVLTQQNLPKIKQQADKYVSSYVYDGADGGYILRVNFNHTMIDRLLAPKAGVPKKLTLRIKGIKDINEYAQVTRCLKNIPAIKQFDVSSLLANEAIFFITADGNKESVSAALNQELFLVAEDNGLDSDPNSLIYKVKL